MKPTRLSALLLLGGFAASPPLAGAEATYTRTLARYAVPDVVLVNQDGARVPLKQLLEVDRPVVVQFVFGSCTTYSPALSTICANLQAKLGDRSRDIQLVSITIDPENDSPRLLKAYLARYRAKPGWDFLTGSREDIDTVLYAFSAYVQNKMYHYPLTLIRAPKDGSWVRIMGLMSSAEFAAECEKVGIR